MRSALAIGIGAASGVAVAALALKPDPAPEREGRDAGRANVAPGIAPGAEPAAAGTAPRQTVPPIADPALERAAQRAAAEHTFRRQIAEFLDLPRDGTGEASAAEAAALRQNIRMRHRDGRLAGSQARALEEEVARRLHPEGSAAAVAAREAIDDAYSRMEAERASAARPDPRVETYKAKEREILSEVLAMKSYPDGLDREAYLERRLEAALGEAYGYDHTRRPRP